MEFSVVGLPHYTVWHLYEPSVDDIRHMEEMEQERTAREKEEKERAERMKKIKEEFKDPSSQWEKEKADVQSRVLEELEDRKKTALKEQAKKIQGEGNEAGPIAQPEKDMVEKQKTAKKQALKDR